MSSVSSIKRWKNSHHKQQSKDLQTSCDEGNMAKVITATGMPKKGTGSIVTKTKQTGNPNQPGKSSKFLLGGNIRDPLNLNSLSDEKVAKAINAVTPQSSPLPTPKHRKAEYKIEVLIPPNISDPLNLMNADACEGDYESQLLSPVLARRKKAVDAHKLSATSGNNSSSMSNSNVGGSNQGGKKPRLRKRTRSAKQSRDSRDTKPPDVNSDSELLGAVQATQDLEKEKITGPKSNEEKDTKISDPMINPVNKERRLTDDNTEEYPNDEQSEKINVERTDQQSKNVEEENALQSKDMHIATKPVYKFPKPTKRPLPFSWKKYRKANQQRKVSGAEIVSPVVQTPPQTSFGGNANNAGIFRGPKPFYRGAKSAGHRRPSYGAKSSSGPIISVSPTKNKVDTSTKQSKIPKKTFEYGNYNRYYGYRNADHGKDPRLRYLNPEWFSGKDILDIGCNVGHVTLSIARNLTPKSILGVDIDENLIRAAKQNVKHYTSCIMPSQTPQYSMSGSGISKNQTPLNTPLYSGRCITPSRTPSYPGWDPIDNVSISQANIPSNTDENGTQTKSANKDDLFPICMPIIFGPIDPTNPSLMPGSVRDSAHSTRDAQGTTTQGSISSSILSFPQNVRFACTNYVLESDELLDVIQPEYDTILCLSTTKWIHLNFGDEGIKRAFKRMYAQLRYGM